MEQNSVIFHPAQNVARFRTHHDDVIKWKHFPRYWPFVRGIHRSPMNSPQRPVTRSFDVFFDMRQNERLSKQPWGWGFETPSRPLWRHIMWKAPIHRPNWRAMGVMWRKMTMRYRGCIVLTLWTVVGHKQLLARAHPGSRHFLTCAVIFTWIGITWSRGWNRHRCNTKIVYLGIRETKK